MARLGLQLAVTVTLAAASGGCRLVVELAEKDVGHGASDANDGNDANASDGCVPWSYQPVDFDPCAIPAPSSALTLDPGAWTFDTNSGTLMGPMQNATVPASILVMPHGGPESRLVSVDAFDLATGATLQVTGDRPLLLVAWSTATVAGTLDVSSTANRRGAGANPMSRCNDRGAAGSDPEGAGGGGGLATAGAVGGTGDNALAAGGFGGLAQTALTMLRGGCAGAAGGNLVFGGAGGAGGGAFHLTARDRIHVSGTVTSGGAGGGGGPGGRGGGGGGGSGGHLGLEAPAIVLTPAAVVVVDAT